MAGAALVTSGPCSTPATPGSQTKCPPTRNASSWHSSSAQPQTASSLTPACSCRPSHTATCCTQWRTAAQLQTTPARPWPSATSTSTTSKRAQPQQPPSLLQDTRASTSSAAVAATAPAPTATASWTAATSTRRPSTTSTPSLLSACTRVMLQMHTTAAPLMLKPLTRMFLTPMHPPRQAQGSQALITVSTATATAITATVYTEAWMLAGPTSRTGATRAPPHTLIPSTARQWRHQQLHVAAPPQHNASTPICSPTTTTTTTTISSSSSNNSNNSNNSSTLRIGTCIDSTRMQSSGPPVAAHRDAARNWKRILKRSRRRVAAAQHIHQPPPCLRRMHAGNLQAGATRRVLGAGVGHSQCHRTHRHTAHRHRPRPRHPTLVADRPFAGHRLRGRAGV